MRGSRPPLTVEQFIERRVVRHEGCWILQGSAKNKYGYMQVSVAGIRHAAHRWFYEQLVGPIPDGFVLDHLCRRPRCVNPEHLEPVTQRENLRRTASDTCGYGHPRTPENTYQYGEKRYCRPCAIDRAHVQIERRRAQREQRNEEAS